MGYRPRVTFVEGIWETVEWVREQAAIDRFAVAQQELERRRLAV